MNAVDGLLLLELTDEDLRVKPLNPTPYAVHPASSTTNSQTLNDKRYSQDPRP
jgi:hypothetical protein